MGLVVWGIASQDNFDTLVEFVDERGITFPILFDEDGSVHAAYSMQTAFQGTIYPQDWIVGADGRVAYANSGYEPETMITLVEEELSL